MKLKEFKNDKDFDKYYKDYKSISIFDIPQSQVDIILNKINSAYKELCPQSLPLDEDDILDIHFTAHKIHKNFDIKELVDNKEALLVVLKDLYF